MTDLDDLGPPPYYEDEHVTIYHGDALAMTGVWAHAAWSGAGVMVSDPPYGIGWSRSANPARQSKAHAGILNDADTSTRDAALAAWGNRPAAVFGSFYAPAPCDVRQILVWAKPADAGVVGSVTGFRRDVEPVFLVGDWPRRTVELSACLRSTEQSIKAVCARTGHPHTKPEDILRTLIRMAPPGIVVDPFMGSGSTLRAAKSLGRHAVGIEMDERYCEIAAKRMAQEVLDFGGAA